MSSADRGERVDLDTILTEDVGQLGRYQLLTLTLAIFPIVFAAFADGEYIFNTARIPTRCVIPQCDGENPEFAPPWVLNAIPGASADSLEECARYAARNASVPSPTPAADSCPAELFDPSQTVPCEAYVYENTHSVVYDFNLACREWLRSQIGSIRSIGELLSLPISGYISDRWGRRVALVLNAFNTGWIGLLRSYVNSYEWFLVLQVLQTALGSSVYASCFILVTELVGPKYRVMAGAATGLLYILGFVMLGLIAWALQPWRTLTQVLYAPQLLIVCYFWILPESVRWLMSQGRYDKAEKILKKVAKVNSTELSKKSMENLRSTAEAEKRVEKIKEPWLVVLVFRSKEILRRCIVCPIWWITNTLVYYGMTVNAVNLAGNKYLNFIAVASMGIPAKLTIILLLDRVGRKPVIIGSYLLCGACQFIFAFLPKGMDGLSLAVYLIGKYTIAVLMTSVYVYTTELFPTKYRHSLFAFCSMVGRIGIIVAPLTPALALEIWAPFPSVLFGSFALLSGLLVLVTPETLGTKLPDTMEEAEQIGSKKMDT